MTGGDSEQVAALASGGLDSGVMLARLAESSRAVHPIYLNCGLIWEAAEKEFLERFVSRLADPRVHEFKS